MTQQSLLNQLEKLQNEMRILILQNRLESAAYDESFLVHMHNLSAKMIWIHRQLKELDKNESLFWAIEKDLTNA